jgi:hypothetical protein
MVEYKNVVGCTGYRVGDDGSVWSRWEKVGLGYGKGTGQQIGRNWKRMKIATATNGYLVVSLKKDDGKRRQFRVHELVLTAFVGICPKGMQACHDPDRTKSNCNLNNLRWGTPKDNRQDSVRHGTQVRGETTGTAVLNDWKVKFAINRLKNGWTIVRIARLLKVGETTVRNIAQNKTWQHIPR